MSYYSNFKPTDGDGDEEDEIEVDASFLRPVPNDILIDVPTTTFVTSVTTFRDPLAEDTPAVATSSEPPPEPKIMSPQCYKDIAVFKSEMEKNISSIISESVLLLKRDP